MGRGGLRHGKPRSPVESCHSLSAWGTFQWAQMWYEEGTDTDFSWEPSGDSAALVHFTRHGVNHSQEIRLTTTHCRYGGTRFWFLCPQCSRRIGKVYLPCAVTVNGRPASRFLCRHCYPLTYLQRQERNPDWSARYRAERIEQRWLGEITEDWISKRKHQHWKTFNRRFEQRERLVTMQDAAFIARLSRILPGRFFPGE